jgi:hypothetical protein
MTATQTGARVVLVPGAPALLPAYASLEDPVAELRAAALAALAWLVEAGAPVAIHTEDVLGLRVAQHLLAEVGASTTPGEGLESVLVVANGSAARTEKAPGFLDPRAEAFDAGVERALRASDVDALRAIDQKLAGELLAEVSSLTWLGEEVLSPGYVCTVDYADDPFGVQYWVMRWTCEH